MSYFAAIHATLLRRTVRHARGFPTDLSRDFEESQEMSQPDVLVIEDRSDAGVFLSRLTLNGEACGDTWHQSVDDARYQAEFEYGEAVGEWRSVPSGVSDPQGFAVMVVEHQEERERN